MSDSSPRVLFVAEGRKEEPHFQDLIDEMPVVGTVFHVNRPGVGNYWRATRWLWNHRQDFPDWIRFRYEKQQMERGRVPPLYRTWRAIGIIQVIAGLMRQSRRLKPQVMFVHNGEHYKKRAASTWAREAGLKMAYQEHGCLPDTIALDGAGVNCNNSVPRSAEFYRQFKVSDDAPFDTTLVKRAPKREVGDAVNLPERYLFVPFQVPIDTQVLINSPWIRSMEDFYQALLDSVDALPEGYRLVVKEHPSSKFGYSHLHDRHPDIMFANANDTEELIDRAQAIITLNSTVGIESLLIGRPVITLGNAFYNIDGLVAHADNVERLRALINKPDDLPFDEELVHGFLSWLKHEYLIPGPWPTYVKETPGAMRKRIEEILDGKYI